MFFAIEHKPACPDRGGSCDASFAPLRSCSEDAVASAVGNLLLSSERPTRILVVVRLMVAESKVS